MNLLPRSLFARLTLVLLGGLLTAQLISFAIHMHDRGELLAQASGMQSAQRIADIVRLLDTMAPVERQRMVKVLAAPPLVVSLGRPPLVAQDAGGESAARARLFASMLRRYLGEDRDIVVGMAAAAPVKGGGAMRGPQWMAQDGEAWSPPMMRHGGGGGGGLSFVAQVALADGTRATFDARTPQATENWPLRLAGSIAVLLIAVVLVSLFAVRWVTRPLRALAGAAEELGRNIHRPPLAETGPIEVVQAARAFNTMQSRLADYLRSRTQMLAAMSHDLKTPVTRLRLRAELLDDTKLREKFDGDLREMELMVSASLDYLRGMDNGEPVQPVDVDALLASLQADFRETGGDVKVEGQALTPYPARAQALKRGLANLIENALKYGGSARVLVEDGPQRLRIRVLDSGPGLPEDQLEKVFEPFYRVEGSRNRDTGGTGLGLAIARNVAGLHAGALVLSNRPGGGLEAEFSLPRSG